MVTCGGCQIKFDRVNEPSVFISGKWYHERCAVPKLEYKALSDYICKLYNLKKIGPANAALIKKFVGDGNTLTGILQTLKYYYEVKSGNRDNAEERIGIVPFVYQEAQNYYAIQEAQRKRVEQSFNNFEPAKEEKSVHIDINKMVAREQNQQNKDLLDLNSLFEE